MGQRFDLSFFVIAVDFDFNVPDSGLGVLTLLAFFLIV